MKERNLAIDQAIADLVGDDDLTDCIINATEDMFSEDEKEEEDDLNG